MVGIYCSSLADGPRCSSSSSAPASEAISADWAGVLLHQMDASGVIPQITAILAPGAEPPAPLVSDFVFTAAKSDGGAGSSNEQSSTSPPGIRRREQLSGCKGDWVAGEDAAAWPVLARQAHSLFRLLADGLGGLLWQQLGLPSGDAGWRSSANIGMGLSAADHSRGRRCCCFGRTEHAAGVQCGSSREAMLRLRELLSYLPASNLAPARQVRLESCFRGHV